MRAPPHTALSRARLPVPVPAASKRERACRWRAAFRPRRARRIRAGRPSCGTRGAPAQPAPFAAGAARRRAAARTRSPAPRARRRTASTTESNRLRLNVPAALRRRERSHGRAQPQARAELCREHFGQASQPAPQRPETIPPPAQRAQQNRAIRQPGECIAPESASDLPHRRPPPSAPPPAKPARRPKRATSRSRSVAPSRSGPVKSGSRSARGAPAAARNRSDGARSTRPRRWTKRTLDPEGSITSPPRPATSSSAVQWPGKKVGTILGEPASLAAAAHLAAGRAAASKTTGSAPRRSSACAADSPPFPPPMTATRIAPVMNEMQRSVDDRLHQVAGNGEVVAATTGPTGT